MMQAGSGGHKQAAHLGTVTLKHADTFMTLQQERHEKKFVRVLSSRKTKNERVQQNSSTHHQVEDSDSPVPRARVQQPVVDLHGVHRLLVALKHALSGQIILTVVGRRICETKIHMSATIKSFSSSFLLKTQTYTIWFCRFGRFNKLPRDHGGQSLPVISRLNIHILRKLRPSSVNSSCCAASLEVN